MIPRSLKYVQLLCLGLNAIVGSGIFLLPDDLYREMGGLSPLAFVCCTLGLLPVALCYAALARRVDTNGGPYVYVSHAFGDQVGFLVGWISYANAVVSFAAVAAAAAAALDGLVSLDQLSLPAAGAALLAVLAFSLLNYRGARPGARAVVLFVAAKFAVLLVLVLVLLPHIGEGPSAAPLDAGWSGLGKATFLALFAVQGFEVVGVPAGESARPERDVPSAVLGSLLSAGALYVLVQGILVATSPDLGRVSDTPLADAALSVAPKVGVLIAIGGLISTLGFISGTALGTPRYLSALAKGGHFLPLVGKTHPRFHSPHIAIIITGAIAALLVLFFDYRSLIGISNVSVGLQYLAVCTAALYAQRVEPGALRLRGKELLPLLGVLVSLWIFSEASRAEFLGAGATLLVGVVLRVVSKDRYRD